MTDEPRKPRAPKPPCPWSVDGTGALLAHLQRLTDAVEEGQRVQADLQSMIVGKLNALEDKVDALKPAPARGSVQAVESVPLVARTTDPRPEPNQWRQP